MRREDVEVVLAPTGRVRSGTGRPRAKDGGRAPIKKSRVVGAPIGNDRREGCPMCARAGKTVPVVFGKDRCIDHLAEQAEGMQIEKVIMSTPVKKKTKSRGALS